MNAMTKYQKNELMKLIGRQKIGDYDKHGTLQDDFEKILIANGIPDTLRKDTTLLATIIDVFLLGAMRGIHADREKKRLKCRSISSQKAELKALINVIDDTWVLNQIHRCILALTKDC